MRILLSLLFIFFVLFSASLSHAQTSSSDVAIPVIVTGQAPQLGDILCSGKGSYVICTNDYDTSIFGVVTTFPAAAFETEEQENQHFVAITGKAIIRVSGEDGPIKKGDLLTSSDRPGIAKKAVHNGFVVGMALEDFEPANEEEVTTLQVSLNIHPTTIFIDVSSNLLEALREGLAAPILTPLAALRYILAAIVTVSSFILGFVYFGKFARVGIEAIGRNPLARLQIQSSIVFNLLLMMGIFLAGIGLSYFILVL